MNNSRKIDGSLNVIGNKIKYYREKNNLSYQKLSDKLMLLGVDIHKQAIYNIEVGKRTIVDGIESALPSDFEESYRSEFLLFAQPPAKSPCNSELRNQ